MSPSHMTIVINPILLYNSFKLPTEPSQDNRKDPPMSILFDKLILLISCMLLFLYGMPGISSLHVASLLFAITFLCLCSCCNLDALPLRRLPAHRRIPLLLLWGILGAACLAYPAFGLLLPLLSYELSLAFEGYPRLAACLLPFLSLRSHSFFLGETLPAPPFGGSLGFYAWASFLLCLLALGLASRTKELLRLKQEFCMLQDQSTEYHLLLQQKNRDLMERQNHEIHIATLKERNRIAREIHDNVGHMLSRALLQSGALMAMNRQDGLREPLNALKATLSSAMDAIRSSVHGLHEDSIDLESAIRDLLSGFSNYQVHMDYDMGRSIPSPVKYCFISITKEALSNIARHSNADKISITLREHPSFYQLMVADNGTDTKKTGAKTAPAGTESPGMGLANMKERVDSLKGHFSFSEGQGFRIFASIPNPSSQAPPIA